MSITVHKHIRHAQGLPALTEVLLWVITGIAERQGVYMLGVAHCYCTIIQLLLWGYAGPVPRRCIYKLSLIRPRLHS
jgi:hypothetical protein